MIQSIPMVKMATIMSAMLITLPLNQPKEKVIAIGMLRINRRIVMTWIFGDCFQTQESARKYLLPVSPTQYP
ncbi:hypothetical protein [Oligoflexus tunisiensis]|uniref:hypothetical protein n=1 Tax=Oligoflexus tunisiensis TaxID=708132 RepID=UPI00114D09FE|nr:hypothetical protein [Oligoflexus tunisiensis]